MKRVIVVSLALSVLGYAAVAPMAARAAEPRVVGATCVPVSGPYKVTASKVTFKADKTGTIILHCPIRFSDLGDAAVNGYSTAVTYRDSGGSAASGHVKVSIVSTNMSTGASSSAAQFNSNDVPPAPGVTIALGAVAPSTLPGTHYHMRVELKRASTKQTVEFYGITHEFSI